MQRRNVKVLKFGGTSMGSAEAIKQVIAIIKQSQAASAKGPSPLRQSSSGASGPRAVVVSAMSGVTDQLVDVATRAAGKDDSYKKLIREIEKRHIAAAEALMSRSSRATALSNIRTLVDSLEGVARGIYLMQEFSLRALDYVMSYGERLSAHLLVDALCDRNVRAEYLNARHVITTDENFGQAIVDFTTTNKAIRAYFKRHPKLQIMTGFIGSTKEGTTSTLGRGGSDYSGSIVGAALGADVIEIWTDVSGVMTADPRKVKDSLPVAALTYLEAAEMSYFGAKVIHPPTMRPAMERRIPIVIKNTFDPKAPGTLIGQKGATDDTLVKGITSMSDVVVIQVEGSGMVGVRGTSGRLFGALARAGVNVILITQASSQHSISFAVARRDAERAADAIEEEFTLERRARLIDPISIERDLSILAIVGEGMKHRRGIAARLFQTLGANGVNVVAIAQGSSELNISVVIEKNDEVKALNAVHAAFFTPERKVLNVFLVGTGVVGSALLQQIAEQHESLAREHGFEIRLRGIGDATRMHFDEGGIPAKDWSVKLRASRKKMHARRFFERMKDMKLPNSVFVDCTPSEHIAAHYMPILEAGISIATPNKCANSGTLQRYQALKACAAAHGVKFLYETNVGAGLPILSTLRDLLLSGDRVRKIEAVLSGTLSYIFDSFDGTKPFSDIVRQARNLGYAEPDPRADLSGLDVARKILILAREIGLPLELSDVEVESLLSKRAAAAKSVDALFNILRIDDPLFAKKQKAAARAGKVLRYVATLNNGKARVALQAVDKSHPFYALYGNDNVIAFFTERYKKSPLIVQGPGAGADVTAAGVFADILRTASTSCIV